MAYRADIEIAVKGAQELKRLGDQISATGKLVDGLNKYLENIGGGGVVRNINNLQETVAKAAATFNKAALGTQEATLAAKNYIAATADLNTGLREKLALLKQVNDAERQQRLSAAGIRETTQYGGPIGPGQATPVALSSQLRGRTEQILAERQGARELTQALTQLEERRRLETNALLDEKAAQVQLNLAREEEKRKILAGAAQQYRFPIGPTQRSGRFRFEGDTSAERAERALQNTEREKQRRLNQQFFAEEKQQLAELDRIRASNAQKQTARLQNLNKTIRGSLSSAAIGGAFPLLFGQSPQAAVGGAIGGLLGGAGGGFAGSLLGTALGEIEAAKARTKELALELGLSSAQAKELSTAFELAGRNSQQLEAAITNIQGLGLSTNETASALKIAVELSKEYGGSVEKIAQAFADTLESGKVSIATLNKFTAQGIPIQDELAKKFGVSRTKLLEMTKDGQISVQQVTNALVTMGIEAEKTADKGKTGFDRFTQAVTGIATAVASAAGALLKILVPALDTVLTKLAAIITRATQAINLLTDATVGEASAALARSGFARGTFTANQGNINDLTQGLKSLQPRLATTKEQFDRIADTTQRYRAELQQYGGSLGEYAVGTAQKELSRVLADLAVARTKLGAAPAPAAIASIIAPANLPPGGKAGKAASDKAAREAERAAEAAAKEAARVKDVIRNRLAEGQILNLKSEQQDRIVAAEIAGDKMLVARLKAAEQQLDIQYRYAQELAKEANLDAQKAIMYEGQNALAANQIALQRELDELQRQSDQDRLTAVQKYIEKQYELNTVVQNQLQLTDGIANTLGEGIGSAFNALVSGAQGWEQSLQQIASGVLIDIANQLIRIFVIEQAINSIKSFLTPFSPSTPLGAGGGMIGKFGTLGPNFGIPQRAKGGPVMGGSPYVVGERGPELFVPGSSGTIIPNDKMGGGVNVVVNVDASGSRVEGDEQEGKQLGRVIAAAIQQELVKQKRPGGLLA